MAKKAMIEREKKRQKLVDKYAAKRADLKAIARNQELPMEERFAARLKLAKLPRNSSATRLHNRCQLTGRPHAYYRKLRISRIMLRESGIQRADARCGQVKLVRERRNERSYRRYADPYPQRAAARASRQ